jgi:hypothetical protein
MINQLVVNFLFHLRRAGSGLLIVIVGYAILALTSTLVQETLLGGVSYQNSPTGTLIIAGVLTPLCAVVSGMFIGAAAPARWLVLATVMSGLILLETSVLFIKRIVDGPLWFEAGAGLALVAGVFAGSMLVTRLLPKRTLANP